MLGGREKAKAYLDFYHNLGYKVIKIDNKGLQQFTVVQDYETETTEMLDSVNINIMLHNLAFEEYQEGSTSGLNSQKVIDSQVSASVLTLEKQISSSWGPATKELLQSAPFCSLMKSQIDSDKKLELAVIKNSDGTTKLNQFIYKSGDEVSRMIKLGGWEQNLLNDLISTMDS